MQACIMMQECTELQNWCCRCVLVLSEKKKMFTLTGSIFFFVCLFCLFHFCFTGGIPDNQLCMQQQSSYGNLIQKAFQCIIGTFSKLQSVLTDSSQGRGGVKSAYYVECMDKAGKHVNI